MRLNGGVRPLQFDRLLVAGDRDDSGVQNIGFFVSVDLAGILLQRYQLRLALKSIEQNNSAVVGQM